MTSFKGADFYPYHNEKTRADAYWHATCEAKERSRATGERWAIASEDDGKRAGYRVRSYGRPMREGKLIASAADSTNDL